MTSGYSIEWLQMSVICFVLAFYHIAEYVIHKIHHPENTDFSSFLITPQYVAAYTIGVSEFLIGCIWFPWKCDSRNPVIYFGLVCICVGLYIRFAAILTAKKSFTHKIAYRLEKEHKLVTYGIYRYIRHPGYTGFYLFAVGTQIFFVNPISVIIYLLVLWKFFSSRIREEEKLLISMFGKDYEEYRKKTPTWIPFVE